MRWADLTQNLGVVIPRLKARFPEVDESEMACLIGDQARFETYVAQAHDLTLREARSELRDFLEIERLARAAFDMRANDQARYPGRDARV